MFGWGKSKQEPAGEQEFDLDVALANVTFPDPSDVCKMCDPCSEYARGYCARHRAQREQELQDQFNGTSHRRRR